MKIKEKFLELTQYTEVWGDEDMIRKYLPEDLIKDKIGNYYIKIGESDTMFTAHLDTAAQTREKVTHKFDTVKHKSGIETLFIETDGTTLLGADDRTGVVIMMYMMEHNIPGLYYFFIGEEVGTKGSGGALKAFPEFFSDYKKCISFDRRGYGSVISQQMGGKCCSNEFAEALSNELTIATKFKHKPDPSGIYTDSAVFMSDIPECTNLSVGYFNEHTHSEYQNISYLERLCEGVLKVEWEKLPVKRSIEMIDSPNPPEREPQEGDLLFNELYAIFDVVEEMMTDTQNKESTNGKRFLPEKEMIFINSYDDTKRLSAWIHHDGSVTIGKTTFVDIFDLEEQIFKTYKWRSAYLAMSKDEEEAGEVFPENEVDLDKDDFEEDLDLMDFINSVESLGSKEIDPDDMMDVLEKYNKSIESLIVWIFHKQNKPENTHGLIWADDKFEFVP